ncbi:PAS domain S-box protein [Desulfoscipio sp. XC116]|uniref:PAS domain S-box protein n=1 Tax=Desulfoscipio sp. XC116 TaxID=3144975 RepID=UPI00325B024A
MLKFLCQQVYQGRGGYLWITDAPFYDGAGCLTGGVDCIRDITASKRLEDDLRQHRYRLEDLVRERTRELACVNDRLQREINVRRCMEKTLRESEKKLKEQLDYLSTLMESMNELFYTYDTSASVVFANRKCRDVLGYRNEEMIGKNIYELVSDRCKERVREEVPKRLQHGVAGNYEIELLHKNGSIRYARLNVAPVVKDGRIAGGMVLAEDISEHKRVEQEMARLERLRIVGEMAATIGHEVRNPMTSVRGFLQILSGKTGCLQYKEYFDLMIDELDRANAIITDFLALAKNKPVEKIMQNINTLVKNLFPLIQADSIKDGKHIDLKLGEVPDLLLDAKEMRQLILNLVRNGLEAMPAEGRVAISTAVAGGEVILAVQDNGCGIEPAVLDKLGTPFFTTKDNGTGLGLAVCYSIAARHNASIAVDCSSAGTTFLVRFKFS